eukprot:CAMPEP_0195008888 /NCGR_PEP_ID=MMETSP0326_2-20130528/8847_1 /TAXON_ID=2866 ORGANISM="Crypthecodinium cohnii, Strain Seligo" /NCGR_SAMPLE_ID=MMETSP0326_2 /ASSEMBLY_ACC=CAM_ASM_000348 /LENGTH=86 /DNA_ID=CAMNT_0040016885 /DNA_START=61 /DNA_END=318 /DNA_ORIENTATION=-
MTVTEGRQACFSSLCTYERRDRARFHWMATLSGGPVLATERRSRFGCVNIQREEGKPTPELGFLKKDAASADKEDQTSTHTHTHTR